MFSLAISWGFNKDKQGFQECYPPITYVIGLAAKGQGSQYHMLVDAIVPISGGGLLHQDIVQQGGVEGYACEHGSLERHTQVVVGCGSGNGGQV